MSALLSDLVQKRRDDAIAYAEYLEQIADLVRSVKTGHGGSYPEQINTPGKKALYDNLDKDEDLTLKVDRAVRDNAELNFRGNKMKERKLSRAVQEGLPPPYSPDTIIDIIRAHDEY
ncbi:hypothetical protein ACT3S5_13435 [Halomonas sp. AOP31-B1-25]